MKLTEKQKAWVDYYKQGHTATEAARLAGYRAKSNHAFESIGHENLRKLEEYIRDRDAVLEAPRIAGMEEINAFWTDLIRDDGADMKDRLKASELRARAAGGFLDRQELTLTESAWFKDGYNMLSGPGQAETFACTIPPKAKSCFSETGGFALPR